MGLKYYSSHTNFVFFHTSRDIVELNAAVAEHGVKIGRPFPPLMDLCRISTGTMEEVKAFTQAFKKVMS